jgi:hypothetical protein
MLPPREDNIQFHMFSFYHAIVALVLIIIAAFLHASWNFVAKKSGGTTTFAFLTALVTSVVWLPVVGIIQFATPEIGISTWSTEAWILVTCSCTHPFNLLCCTSSWI